MKSKILALSKNEEFKNLIKQKKISNKYVTIFFGYLPNKDKKKLNISFSVKKKIAIAVKRNKIKRRLRQIFNDGIKQNLIKLEKKEATVYLYNEEGGNCYYPKIDSNPPVAQYYRDQAFKNNEPYCDEKTGKVLNISK